MENFIEKVDDWRAAQCGHLIYIIYHDCLMSTIE